METLTKQPGQMDLADLLDASGKLYLQNAALFLGVIGILVVIQVVIRLALGATAGGTLDGLLYVVGEGALIQAIAARYQGREMTVGQAYSTVGVATFVYLIVANILYIIAVGIGLVLLIIPGIYLAVRLAFIPQAIIVERADIFASFSRSWDLVQGNWWRVFGYSLVVSILTGLLQGVAQGIGGVGSVLALIVQAAIMPFFFGVLTLLYFDLRARKGESVLTSTAVPY